MYLRRRLFAIRQGVCKDAKRRNGAPFRSRRLVNGKGVRLTYRLPPVSFYRRRRPLNSTVNNGPLQRPRNGRRRALPLLGLLCCGRPVC